MSEAAAHRAGGVSGVDIEARNAVVIANLGLVRPVAKGYRGRGLDLDDLIQCGYLGLIRAAETFDPGRGYRFSTYAHFWISKEIRVGIAAGGSTVRVGHHAREDAWAVYRRMRAMSSDLHEPELGEVLDAMVADGALAPEARERVGRAYLACGPRRAGVPVEEMGAAATEPDATGEAEEREQVRLALPLLPCLHRTVIERSYGLDGGPPAGAVPIGRTLGLGDSAILRMRREAAGMLRELVEGGPARRG